MSKEFEEEVSTPSCELHFSPHRTLIRVSVQNIEGHASNKRQILGAWFLRARALSSENVTSSVQCRLFSTLQCSRAISINLRGSSRLDKAT